MWSFQLSIWFKKVYDRRGNNINHITLSSNWLLEKWDLMPQLCLGRKQVVDKMANELHNSIWERLFPLNFFLSCMLDNLRVFFVFIYLAYNFDLHFTMSREIQLLRQGKIKVYVVIQYTIMIINKGIMLSFREIQKYRGHSLTVSLAGREFLVPQGKIVVEIYSFTYQMFIDCML